MISTRAIISDEFRKGRVQGIEHAIARAESLLTDEVLVLNEYLVPGDETAVRTALWRIRDSLAEYLEDERE